MTKSLWITLFFLLLLHIGCAYDPMINGGTTIYMQDTSDYSDDTYTNQIIAGQLTAAEWDDLDNWNFWKGLISNSNCIWCDMSDYWGIRTLQRVAVRAMYGTEAAMDVKVEIINPLNHKVWQSRTDVDGEANLFINCLVDYAGPFHLKVTSGSNISYMSNVSTTGNTYLNIYIDQSNTVPDLIDIMFTIDTTGSMADELEYLQVELEDVIRRVKRDNSGIKTRLSGNYYRDFGSEYVIHSFPFTTNTSQFIAQMNAHSAGEGGDYEEAVDIALTNAIFVHEWSTNARARILFLVLDAPPHYETDVLNRIYDSIESASAMGIRVIPIIASGADEDTEALMRMLAITTGGTFVFLTDNSGIGDDHLEPKVGNYEVEYLNDLLVRVISDYIN